MSQQAPKKILTELGFTKLAVPAHSQTTGDRVRAILHSESLTGVFLVGDNPRLQAELDDLGIRVDVLVENETVPGHVFMLEDHHGFWGSVNLETGVVRDVDFAMDSVGATRALLGALYPEFRHEYAVRPVMVQVLPVSPLALTKSPGRSLAEKASELADLGLFRKPATPPKT